MKKTVVALSLAAMTLPALAQQKAAEPEYTIAGNFGLTSDYRFRGASQSNKDPAVQGGIDFAHKSGIYLGSWNSSVGEWASPFGSGIEMDLYGGYKTEIGGVGVDIGGIYYYYPGAQFAAADTKNHVNTSELYLGLAYGPVAFKMSRTMSEYYFGIGPKSTAAGSGLLTTNTSEAKGTMYYDLSFATEIAPKTSVKLRGGMLKLNDSVDGSIKDYSVGLAYDLEGWMLGLNYYSMSLSASQKAWFTSTDSQGTKLYDNGFALSVTKTF